MLALQALCSAYLRLLFVVVRRGSLIIAHPKDMYVYFGQELSMPTFGFHNYHEQNGSDSKCSWEGRRMVAVTASCHYHIAVSYRGSPANSVIHIRRRVSHLRSETAIRGTH